MNNPCKSCGFPVDNQKRKHCIFCIIRWKRKKWVWRRLMDRERAVISMLARPSVEEHYLDPDV